AGFCAAIVTSSVPRSGRSSETSPVKAGPAGSEAPGGSGAGNSVSVRTVVPLIAIVADTVVTPPVPASTTAASVRGPGQLRATACWPTSAAPRTVGTDGSVVVVTGEVVVVVGNVVLVVEPLPPAVIWTASASTGTPPITTVTWEARSELRGVPSSSIAMAAPAAEASGTTSRLGSPSVSGWTIETPGPATSVAVVPGTGS